MKSTCILLPSSVECFNLLFSVIASWISIFLPKVMQVVLFLIWEKCHLGHLATEHSVILLSAWFYRGDRSRERLEPFLELHRVQLFCHQGWFLRNEFVLGTKNWSNCEVLGPHFPFQDPSVSHKWFFCGCVLYQSAQVSHEIVFGSSSYTDRNPLAFREVWLEWWPISAIFAYRRYKILPVWHKFN